MVHNQYNEYYVDISDSSRYLLDLCIYRRVHMTYIGLLYEYYMSRILIMAMNIVDIRIDFYIYIYI